ncbi:hypothetical protein HK098_002592 [Nowakowskiella sp. JEL0407]|nr:hypothetical protein HK098_002592 [Nowakowskiella sp. JEL0407]
MSPTNNIFVAVPVALLTLWASRWVFMYISTPKKLSKDKKLATYDELPGPVGCPLFGSFSTFVYYIYMKRSDLFVQNITETYGPISKFTMLGKKVVVIADAKIMRTIFRNSSDAVYRSDSMQIALEGITPLALFALPTGIADPGGDTWKKHRKGIQPAFGPKHIRDSVGICVKYVDSLLDFWMECVEKSNGRAVREVLTDMTAVAGDIISKFALGIEFGAVESIKKSENNETMQVIQQIAYSFGARLYLTDAKFIWPLLNISTKQLRERTQELFTTFIQQIEDRRNWLSEYARKNIDWETSDSWISTLLDRLVLPEGVPIKNALKYSDDEIRDEVLGFFGAGQESSTLAFVWMIYEICLHEEVQKKLKKEIDESIQDKAPTHDDLLSMKYLDAVLKETLRVHAVFTHLGRQIWKEYKVTGDDGVEVVLPANSNVILNIRGVQMSKKYWGDEAEEFKPERWIRNEGEPEFSPAIGTYVPFGDGPFNCIGQKLAIVEIKVSLIRMLQRFDLSIASSQGDIEPSHTITFGLRCGLLLDLKKRTEFYK